MKSRKIEICFSTSFKILLLSAVVFSYWLIGGCAAIEFLTPSGAPSREQLIENYNKVELGRSSASDVLSVINLPKYELLSQSQKVIASTGKKKKGYAQWFKLVAFDENAAAARRKYFFIVDEKPKALFAEPWARAEFYSDIILEKEVLDKPYANENSSRIAILKHFLTTFHKDIDEVTSDNELFPTCRGLVNQGLNAALQKLKASPAEAAKLDKRNGLEFEHISFDKGRIRMTIDRDILTLEMKLGSV